MALSNKQKAKVARDVGRLAQALVKGLGKRKPRPNRSTSAPATRAPSKGCGACG